MSLAQYPFFQLSVGLISGILLHNFIAIDKPFFWLLPILWIALVILWKIDKRVIISPLIFSLFLFVCVISLGFALRQIEHPNNIDTHYIHEKFQKPKTIELLIHEELKENQFQKRYIATSKTINGNESSGKLLLTIQKDSLYDSFSADDVLLIYGFIEPINEPQNPGQFNYKNYLENKGVYGQLNTSSKNILLLKESTPSLFGRAQKTQKYLTKKLDNTSLKEESKSIIKALILGDRSNVETNLYEAYANAGAIHILAVSGLHVGILFFILSNILKPFERFFLKPLIKQILIVILLWSFAFITGLSPSVVRAVTMFSFFSLAQAYNRKNDSMNTLFISLFAILIIRPNWLFHIGFQLSYFAVFFILWLLPLFDRLYRSKWLLIRKIYGLVCVSICAQIGVAPLSIFYFHQFPGLFLITNLIILPFMGLVLLYGLIIVLLSGIGIHISFMEYGLDRILSVINEFVYWIANQNQFLFENLVLSKHEIFIIYVLIFSMGMFSKKLNKKWFLVGVFAMLLFYILNIADNIKSSESLFILHKNRNSIVAIEHQNKVQILHNSNETILSEWPIKNWGKTTNKDFIENQLPAIFEFNSMKFIIVDSLGLYPKSIGANIILTQNAKIKLNRLLDSLKPKMIIADGSNYKQMVQLWKISCEKREIPFYSTFEKGAIEFKKNP